VRRFAGTPLFLSETIRRCDERIFAVNSSAICQKIAEVSVEKNQFLAKRNKFKQVQTFQMFKIWKVVEFILSQNQSPPQRCGSTAGRR
jgi:hypothetical protein